MKMKKNNLSRPGKQNGMYGVHRNGESNPFFGKRHTEETKQKLSVANKGKTPWLGKKHDEETRRKMSLAKKGRKLTEEWKQKIRDSVPRGENSPHWKGGITPIHKAMRVSAEYKEWALFVKMRDDFTCQGCGQVGGNLHSHHIKTLADYPELAYDVSNGITLCINCHRLTDTYGRYIRNNLSR